MVCVQVPFTKMTEITKTTKTSQTATNKELSARFTEITETTKMTKTMGIQGANHGFPKPRVQRKPEKLCSCEQSLHTNIC